MGHGLVVLKYSRSGMRLWVYQTPGKGRDERAINIVVGDRAVYVAAHSCPIPPSPEETDLLLKLSAEGKEEWRHVSPAGGRLPSSPRVAVDKDELVYLASQSKPGAIHGAFRESQIILMRFSSDGTQKWRKALSAGAEEEDYPIDLKADPRGGVVLNGLSEGWVWHILCASYSSTGVSRYAHKVLIYPGANLKPPRIWVDHVGNVALTASTFTGITGRTGHEYDAITAFIKADGEMSWNEQYDGPDHLADQGMAVTTEEGKFYSAVQATEGGIREIQILKYSPFPDQLTGH
jgi:outer membrane protein assembly factor BamB